ncbi:MAG: biotin--[acetyl-CoA-carboxylase] ligase [Alphaproteobacteria bacterium]|nr:biotin--[acetyl-CoA-carboxylase] ligase [Alphaproteobacteria bacterium]
MPVWVPETTSTQDAVRTWARARRPAGSALVAEHQTEGRGRLGRSWVAPAGQAVLLSVLLRPQLPPDRLGLLPLAAAVGVRIATHGRLGIKWPNDLLAPDGRKVAGILAESEIEAGSVAWVVVGVGLNLRGVPAEVGTAACLDELGPPLRKEDLAIDVLASVQRWTALVETAPERVLQAWRRGSVTLGRRVRVGAQTGVAEDVAPDGALWLRRDDGERTRVVAGDVEIEPSSWSEEPEA